MSVIVQKVRPERTMWRDAALSLRHREWGFNCPAVDIDFIMAEFDHSAPVALVEYKHCTAAPVDPQSPSMQALRLLADNYSPGALPFIVAFYDPDQWSFKVTPMNKKAEAHYRHCLGEVLSERRFVKSLYAMRSKEFDSEMENSLNASKAFGIFTKEHVI